MNQLDWIGGGTSPKPFKDIRRQRDGIAERKAELLLELGALITKAPASVINGSIQSVRQWSAAKIAGNKRSSVIDLERAISSMKPWR